MSESQKLTREIARELPIVPLTREFAEKYYLFKHACWLDTYPSPDHNITKEDIEAKFNRSSMAQKIAYWEREIEKKGEISSVIIWNNQVIASCAIVEKEDYIQLLEIYVHPDFQGLGIASRMVRKELSKVSDKKDVLVELVDYNQKAIAFYQKMGFEFYKQSEQYEIVKGKVVQLILMIIRRQSENK